MTKKTKKTLSKADKEAIKADFNRELVFLGHLLTEVALYRVKEKNLYFKICPDHLMAEVCESYASHTRTH